jgi:Cu(I)/Ag(I) efflux system membrane fusion protein/cobalt-zinc-cadmium efflux system membrane fusion protein
MPYEITDLSKIWVLADAYESDLSRIELGMTASLSLQAFPNRTFRGRVIFVDPILDAKTRTAKIRLEFPNPTGELRPEMFGEVTMQAKERQALRIPADAVVDSGTKKVVFVALPEGKFQPRGVRLGAVAGDAVEVVSGLAQGERVVTRANFLVDSESQLQAALGSYAPPPPGAGAASARNAPAAQATLDFSSVPSPPRKGDNTFRVKLADKGGAPVAGAQVSVTFFMPALPALGMASMRTVSNLNDKGNGQYEGSGNLGSGGTWQVTIVAQKNGQTLASKQLTVSASGGM